MRFVYRALTVLGLATALGVVLFFLWWARHIFILAFAGILPAVFLQTTAEWLYRRIRVPYLWSLTTVVLAVLVVVGVFGWMVGARMSQEVGQLAQQVPASFECLWSQFQQTSMGQALGQLFAMVVLGILTGLGLWLIGVRLPLALGLLAFLLEVVPYIGQLLSLIPALLLAWSHSP